MTKRYINIKEYVKNTPSLTLRSVLNMFFDERKSMVFVNNVNYPNIKKVDGLGESLICFDGISNSLTLSILLNKKVERVSFDNSSIAPRVFSEAKKRNFTIVLIGEKDCVHGKFKKKLIEEHGFKDNEIFHVNGFMTNTEIIEKINKFFLSDKTLFIVGIGTPKQENLLVSLKKIYPNACVTTCGGFIRQSSEKWVFYPNWINKFHLRAFYRLFKEKHTRNRLPAFLKGYYCFLRDIIR